MKKAIIACLLAIAAIGALANSVTITVIADDGNGVTTNVVNVSEIRVKGLLEAWAQDTKNKESANPPVAALTFGQFVVQEIGDKGAEYQDRGATADMLAWGITNPPVKLVKAWPTLTSEQKTNALNYHNQIGN